MRDEATNDERHSEKRLAARLRFRQSVPLSKTYFAASASATIARVLASAVRATVCGSCCQ